MAITREHSERAGMSPTVAPGARAIPDLERYRWIAMGIVLIGTFMVILDTTIVNVALPQIGVDFRRGANVDWIVTAYLLAVGAVQPVTGWLADRFGKKWIFVISLLTFTVGSALCAAAPNLLALVGFRVLQGLGGGAMMPVALATIYELFPPDRRGTALGIWGIAAMAAPTVGPVIGGYIATSASWRWLFLVNVPVGVVGGFAAVRLLRNIGYREHRRLDWQGMVVLGVGLVLLLLAFSEARTWRWGSTRFALVTLVGLVLLAGYVARARKVRHPLVELQMFANPTFSITIVIVTLLTLAQFGRLVFIPLEFETLRGMSALKVGLMMSPGAIGIAITMPLGGRMADRIGPRVPVLVGVLVLAAASWGLAHLTLTTPISTVILLLVLGGLGNGLSIMPNTVAAMNALPSRFVSQASAVRALTRQVSGALVVAILASLVATRIGAVSANGRVSPVSAQAAYNMVFLIGVVASLAAAVLVVWLPGKAATHATHAERAAEFEESLLEH